MLRERCRCCDDLECSARRLLGALLGVSGDCPEGDDDWSGSILDCCVRHNICLFFLSEGEGPADGVLVDRGIEFGKLKNADEEGVDRIGMSELSNKDGGKIPGTRWN
jgi:hypothetical protein